MKTYKISLMLTILNPTMRSLPPKIKRKSNAALYACLIIALFSLINIVSSSCRYGLSPEEITQDKQSQTTKQQKRQKLKEFAIPESPGGTDYATEEKIKTASEAVPSAYQIGPGDVLSISVWNRPDLSKEGLAVSPDGKINVPRIGIVNVKERTVKDVQKEIRSRLLDYYTNPNVTLSVSEYNNNKAYVLGRVSEPGIVEFSGQGTLLKALAKAGGLPHTGKETFLRKCAIIRGDSQILWIDLKELLENGNMMLNAHLKNNDVVFIPESDDEFVYVMGEVVEPGAVSLKRGLTLLDAVMQCGGVKIGANLEKVFIIRPNGAEGQVQKINMKAMLENAKFDHNYSLEENDVVFVSPEGIQRFNYALEQSLPFLKFLNLSTDSLEKFGVMERLREALWGQTGFVSD